MNSSVREPLVPRLEQQASPTLRDLLRYGVDTGVDLGTLLDSPYPTACGFIDELNARYQIEAGVTGGAKTFYNFRPHPVLPGENQPWHGWESGEAKPGKKKRGA